MNFVKRNWIWAALAVILLIVGWVQADAWKNDVSLYDIYYHFKDGQFLRHHENPYSRVLEGDMTRNNKYTTILPGFPIAAYLTQRFIFHNDFRTWVGFWRWIFLFSNLGITTLAFLAGRPRRFPFLAMVLALTWGLNRWMLYLYKVSGLDPLPLFFVALALFLFAKHRWWGLISLGISLATKQMAIFIMPIFLLQMFLDSLQKRSTKAVVGETALSGAAVIGAPLLVSLPFLYWDWKGLVMSVFFSATRSGTLGRVTKSGDAIWENSIDTYLHLQGFAARLPMLSMFALVYLAAWRYRIHYTITCMLTMFIFVCFNPLLYSQYFPWFLVCVPFAVGHLADSMPTSIQSETTV